MSAARPLPAADLIVGQAYLIPAGLAVYRGAEDAGHRFETASIVVHVGFERADNGEVLMLTPGPHYLSQAMRQE